MAIQDDINNFNTSSTALDLLELAAQTKSTTTNRIVKVADVNALPDLANDAIDPGTIIFVESIKIPVVAGVGRWTGLDNRNLRVDRFCVSSWAWGRGTYGILGNGTTNRSSPISVVGGFTDWCQVEAGFSHSLGVRTNGTLWAWGCNSLGQLGDNTTVSKSSPVSVVGGFTDWCQVSAGQTHNLGVRTNGTVWAWGCNSLGQLGDNTTVSKSSPVSVVGGFTDWCQVSTGKYHSLGLRSNGTAWTWGSNASVVLGTNEPATASKSSPVSVVGGFTDWCQVSAGQAHNLGLRTNGTLWSWGTSFGGVLGDNNSVINRSSPVSVVGGFTDWCRVSAGQNHNLGVRTNGTLWAWGFNACGPLGDNTTVSKSSPVSVIGGFTDWCHVSAGYSHSLGVRTNGTAWAWGSNGCGILGDGTTASKSSPVSVVGGFTDWCQVSANICHSIGLRKI